MRKILTLLFALLFLVNFNISAQEEKAESDFFADGGVDLVSAYIWRGIAFDNAPNVQGQGIWGYRNFSVGAWASINYDGSYFEPNLWVSYTHRNITLTITDVDAGFGNNFFNYKPDETLHLIDAAVQYTVSEDFPLRFTGAVVFYGFDKKVAYYHPISSEPVFGAENNYSSYFEIAKPFTLGETTLELAVGAATHESPLYETQGFGVTNIGVSITKPIHFSDKFSLPVGFSVIANPDANKLYAVCTISF